MPAPTKEEYAHLKPRRRMEIAVKAVLRSEETSEPIAISEAARIYGVDRSGLSRNLKAARKELADREARARQALEVKAGRIDPLGINEKRRVPRGPDFHRMYFGHLPCGDCGTPHALADHHIEMLSVVGDRGNSRVIALQPPGHAKSTTITVRDNVNLIAEDPNVRIVIVSETQALAKAFLFSITELLSNEDIYAGAERNLILDWGPFQPYTRDRPWTTTEIYCAGRQTAEKDPTVKAIGVGNQIYGFRADRIVFDDIATTKNMANPEMVKQIISWQDKMALSRLNKGQAIWVGTRVSPGDIYGALMQRDGYLTLKYPAIFDEAAGRVLWPEHMDIDELLIKRSDFSDQPALFELIYQQVDVPEAGMPFTMDLVEPCLDHERALGQFDPSWHLIAGVDPAGAGPDSGYSAFFLLGIDPVTGARHLVDVERQLQMKAPDMKAKILEWANRYENLAEFRVEVNGLQRQIFQYDEDLVRPLSHIGKRITPHVTNRNKYDPEFGVETLTSLFAARQISLPYAAGSTRTRMKDFLAELYTYPIGTTTDMVMAFWFAELGARDFQRRSRLPLFDRRADNWPKRVKRGRRMVDFANGRTERIPIGAQAAGGHPMASRLAEHRNMAQWTGASAPTFANMPGRTVPTEE